MKGRKESEGAEVALEEKEIMVEEERSRRDHSIGECSLTKSTCERVSLIDMEKASPVLWKESGVRVGF